MEKPLRVLIIEDSENDAILLLRQLRQSGYAPDYALVDTANGFTGVLNTEEWDIIISDYVLPEFSGLDVLKLVQAKGLDIPCIIVSGKITDEIAVEAMRAGARDYIMKDNLKRLGPAIERELAEADVRRERRKAEMKVKKRTAELARANEQLKFYTREIIRVQEEERKRIALELHDDTAQSLALLTLEIDKILESKEKLPENVILGLQKLRKEADRTQKDIRRISHELRPGVLDNLGLEAALKGLADDVNDSGQLKVELEAQGDGRRLSAEVELALFRIAQEALSNSRKHAQAAKACVKLKYSPRKVNLTVSDNGNGFDVKRDYQSAVKRRRLGLIGMTERAQLIGGNLKIRSIKGVGTTVSIEVASQGR